MRIRQWISTSGTIGAVLLAMSAVHAADPPTIKQALGLPPQNSDVDYDMPDPKLYDQCKVAPLREGKATGWIVTGPAGQPLRRFMDTNGDDVVDQFSYFKNGLEVYRDIDSNFNKKKDQFRWFNTGGMRWAIDTNEDGKIDVWKQISAEEVSRIAVRALVTKDETLLAPLLVSKADLRQLGIKGPLESKLLASVADPRAKIEKAIAKSKIIQTGTIWIRFDAAPPAAIPADTNKTSEDLVVYENVMAIVDYGNPMAPGLVHIGELIRVGEVWKMTSLPVPMEGSSVELAPGLVLNEPLLNTPGASPALTGAVTPKVQEAVARVQKLMENPPPPGSPRSAFEKYQKELEGELTVLINESKTDDERDQWTRQLLDTLASAVQSGADPGGLSRLKRLESEIVKASPKSPLIPIARYRLMVAEFAVAMQEAENNDDRQKVHDRWLTELNDFLDAYPKADDAPDAALQLAVALEFAGKVEKAKTWYERIVEDYRESQAMPRAAGALKRLDLAGKALALSGPGLSGGTVDVKQFKGKLVCIFFWDTSSKLCLEDLPLLKGLYESHHAQGFEVIGVNLDPVKTPVGPYLVQQGVKWPQIYEQGGLESSLAKEYGIISLPTMFIVDADGKVLNRSATIADLKTTLAEKLAKK